jgi:ectoine hydroxylase-related dioxygenase (phytanoyl-CoA dioxygenase family)
MWRNSPTLRQYAISSSPCSAPEPSPLSGTLFDKTPDANWKVPWHQDLSIAVQQKIPIDGFGPWSVKAGVVHVQPPAAILETMLAVRIHLDDCNEENGPVRVIPGSHQHGRLTAEQIRTIPSTVPSISCPVGRGGVLLMRPLLLHASSASQSPHHRRVIHIDFASGELPSGLKWFSEPARLILSA